jgi:hypothetical protein
VRGILLLAVMTCPGLSGCVYRQLIITSDPPGAEVQINGKTIGTTPVDYSFIWYGTYRVTLVRDGKQTLIVDQPVPAPWYEWIGLDFVSENLLPFTVRDIRRYHYQMKDLELTPPEFVLQRSEQLRDRGHGIGVAPAPLQPAQAQQPAPPGAEVLPVPSTIPPGTGTGVSPVPQFVPQSQRPPEKRSEGL